MNIRLIAYSARGCATAARLSDALTAKSHVCARFARTEHIPAGDTQTQYLDRSAVEWAKAGFESADALIFCCAAGIAVRAIAPWVRSKKTDPAVLVVDELGRWCIPILSGHIGGGNALAREAAEGIGAACVVTTATDLNGLFAVDVFAVKNHLYIENMLLAKEVSAALLAGKAVGFRSDLPVADPLPPELTAGEAELGICVSADASKKPFPKTLRLIPQKFAAGLGCRRDKDAESLERFFLDCLAQAGVDRREVRCLASIDVKKDEPGLLALAEKYRLPFLTYAAEELNALPGEFSRSAFVRGTVGVDCVCERAAVKAAGGKLVKPKTAADGMTFALAEYEEEIRFE